VKRGTTGFVDFAPDYASPPGALLDAVLDALDLTQSDLADRTGLSTKYVNQIIKKHVTITAETAVRLEAATDVPADTWMRLEAQYRAEAARAERRRGLQAWVHWLRQFNLPELRQRGVVRSAGDDADVVDDLLRFFGISSPDSWERVWQSSLTRFRRSPSFKPELAATTVWLRIGQRKARCLNQPKDLNSYPNSAPALASQLSTRRKSPAVERAARPGGQAPIRRSCSSAIAGNEKTASGSASFMS
jgi:HTH-type transcriptional regulator/antitoxin HigA